ncbi:hypothetical protein GCM10009730_39500 [Streptomyces albidochromogenes]
MPGRSPQGVERNSPEQPTLPERSAPEETPRRGTDPRGPVPAHPPQGFRQPPPTGTLGVTTPTGNPEAVTGAWQPAQARAACGSIRAGSAWTWWRRERTAPTS